MQYCARQGALPSSCRRAASRRQPAAAAHERSRSLPGLETLNWHIACICWCTSGHKTTTQLLAVQPMALRVGGPSLLQRLRALAAAIPAAGARCLSDAAPSGVAGRLPADGRTLQDFIRQGHAADGAGGTAAAAQGTIEHTAAAAAATPTPQPASAPSSEPPQQRTAFVETYGCEWVPGAACSWLRRRNAGAKPAFNVAAARTGCRPSAAAAAASLACQATRPIAGQMNVNDSEVVAAVLREAGYGQAAAADAADVVLLNTCAIRENAEAKVRLVCQPRYSISARAKCIRRHRQGLATECCWSAALGQDAQVGMEAHCHGMPHAALPPSRCRLHPRACCPLRALCWQVWQHLGHITLLNTACCI